jgi:hypothetical protein
MSGDGQGFQNAAQVERRPTIRTAIKTAIHPRIIGTRDREFGLIATPATAHHPFFCALAAAAAHVERMSRNSQVSASSGMR